MNKNKEIALSSIKQTIISNDEYIEWMNKISIVENDFAISSNFNNMIALDHGVKHMNRVAETVYKLMKEYGSSQDDCYLGYIAGLIHDIGMIYGKNNHAQNGSEMARNFLKKLNILDVNEIEVISSAIAIHGNGAITENNIGLFLTIADKIDMCKDRFLGEISPIQLIDGYRTNIHQNTIEIYYEMSSLNGVEALYMIPKSIDIPQKIAKYLGLKVKFFINGKKEDFIDRENYSGQVYMRKEKILEKRIEKVIK